MERKRARERDFKGLPRKKMKKKEESEEMSPKDNSERLLSISNMLHFSSKIKKTRQFKMRELNSNSSSTIKINEDDILELHNIGIVSIENNTCNEIEFIFNGGDYKNFEDLRKSIHQYKLDKNNPKYHTPEKQIIGKNFSIDNMNLDDELDVVKDKEDLDFNHKTRKITDYALRIESLFKFKTKMQSPRKGRFSPRKVSKKRTKRQNRRSLMDIIRECEVLNRTNLYTTVVNVLLTLNAFSGFQPIFLDERFDIRHLKDVELVKGEFEINNTSDLKKEFLMAKDRKIKIGEVSIEYFESKIESDFVNLKDSKKLF